MIILSKFVERLKELMILNNYTIKTLAETTGIHQSTIGSLLREEHHPSTKALLAFAQLFNCPCDYLLGLIDDYPEPIKFSPPTSDFGARLRLLLRENNVSQYSLTKKEKISGNLLYQWLNNQAIPSVYNLEKLASALQISVDCLLGREN